VTFIPSVFGSPHLLTVHAPGRRPVVQYRRGRCVHYVADLPALTALGTDLLAAVLR